MAKMKEINRPRAPKKAKMRRNQGPKGQNQGRQARKDQNEKNWPRRGRVTANSLGFRVSSFDRQCGGDRPRCQSMAATAQLYLGLYVRVFQPLAQLGPLRALTASVRALSETLGFRWEAARLRPRGPWAARCAFACYPPQDRPNSKSFRV